MKLYNIYNIISRKTVRQHENFYRKYRKNNKYVLGHLVKTNRGYFIDGNQVDLAAVSLWNAMNKNEEYALIYHKMWQAELERIRKENELKEAQSI